MILGIDASNIRAGGGITHLRELIRHVEPQKFGFNKVIVWSGEKTLKQLNDKPWLVKEHYPVLDKSLLYRSFWQKFALSNLARNKHCDLLYIPGGSFSGNFRPVVAFSQNLLPFEWKELRRFRFSRMILKMVLLRYTQSRTFRNADGVIFLTKYSKNVVEKVIGKANGKTAVIAHGVDNRFKTSPRLQKPIKEYSESYPFRILYVSTVDAYKHQWWVVEAVSILRKSGLPVVLELVGASSSDALTRLQQSIEREDPEKELVVYSGMVPFCELHTKYIEADLFIFASSCENMPNILLEAMASGLPIACSNLGPMPEILETAGTYFNPEVPMSIADAVRKLIDSIEQRTKAANKAFLFSDMYSWEKCANETFGFLKNVIECYQGKLGV